MGQIWFQTRSIEFEVVRLDRFCRPIDLGHGLLLGWARWARWARRQFGGSQAVLLYEVLGRGSCRDPVEILEDS